MDLVPILAGTSITVVTAMATVSSVIRLTRYAHQQITNT